MAAIAARFSRLACGLLLFQYLVTRWHLGSCSSPIAFKAAGERWTSQTPDVGLSGQSKRQVHCGFRAAWFCAGKLVNGRKRHILVDTLGLLMTGVVTAAGVQDRDGARLLLSHLPGGCKKMRKIWVDGGYSGRLVEWVAERFKFCLAVVLRPKQTKKFVLLPRRWVVERTFG